ncbi:MAG: trans-2-enoyl-CoA reductase family protein [Clostridiales bacterium]|nr:trans-2-enoyl-CoA reductase family protein [Clostridiales bacterium]
MIIKPKSRGFICTTAHPLGCKKAVENQIKYVKSKPKLELGKKVLVIGSSMGYGLSSRIVSAFSSNAATIGVIFDKSPSENRTASAGWYNTAAFEEFAHGENLYAKTINGDAYSDEIKQQVIDLIKKDLGKVDAVIYSLASPRRVTQDKTYTSVLKPIGRPFSSKSIDLKTNKITEVTIDPATNDEIEDTIKVMGGEDWQAWIDALVKADAIENDAITLAYSYIGPTLTHAIYKDGTIGQAKNHLYTTADVISEKYNSLGIKAYVSVNKALVTQSSAAIPVVPLYISLLFKTMKEKGTHEGCIEQIYRLFSSKFQDGNALVDENGLIRLDDWEMDKSIQRIISKNWGSINDENLHELTDLEGFWNDFYAIFGFGIDGVDENNDVSPLYQIESLI